MAQLLMDSMPEPMIMLMFCLMRLSLHINCTIFHSSLLFSFSVFFSISLLIFSLFLQYKSWTRRGVEGVDNALTHSQCLTYFQRCRRRRRCHLAAYIAQRVRQRQRQKRRHGMAWHGLGACCVYSYG